MPTEWALVTGASSGLGTELAGNLAARGCNIVLTARRAEAMERLADRIRVEHGVEAVVEALDMAQPGAAALLQARLDARGIEPAVLVNNAAFGIAGAFVDQEPDRLQDMLQLNVVALTELSLLFGRRMAARQRGHILLVASMAAYQPTPLLAAYGASKAYVLSLGEALHVELAGRVGVTVLSPGLMDTGFAGAAGYTAPEAAKRTVLPPAQVAAIGLDALFAGRPSVVAGRLNQIMALGTRFTSRHRQARAIFRMAAS